jgi:hypothetical protein
MPVFKPHMLAFNRKMIPSPSLPSIFGMILRRIVS